MAETLAPGIRLGRWRQAAATGRREYLGNNPPRIVVMTLLPRAILQTVFFSLIGQLAGGEEGRRYAFVGAVAFTITLSTIVGITEVPSDDKWSGTFWRVRIGRLAPFTVFILRSWPYPVVGFATAVATLLAIAPIMGADGTGPRLVSLVPCLALLAVTTAAAGLAAAAFSVARRADIIVSNLIAYVILLCSGALVPPGRLTWLDMLGDFLPMRHGLLAMRALQARQPFAAELGLEVAVGACWLAAAWVLVRVQAYRARAAGHDEFA